MVEGARLESVFRGNSNVGSNPTLSATYFPLGDEDLAGTRESRLNEYLLDCRGSEYPRALP